MESKPPKKWPLFVVGAMVVVAIFLKLEDIFFPGSNEIEDSKARSGPGSSTSSASSTFAFGETAWTFERNAEKKVATPSPITTYTESDFETLADASIPAIQRYANDLKYALRAYTNPQLKSEVEATMAIYEKKKDAASLTTIESNKAGHDSTLTDLLTIAVPKVLLPYHVEITNTVNRMSYLTGNMAEVEANPLLALTSARVFGAETERFGAALERMNGAFRANGFQVSPKESIRIYLNISQ